MCMHIQIYLYIQIYKYNIILKYIIKSSILYIYLKIYESCI